ncbi:hypothetical protein GJ496_006495 [Pomphorhynchus laevis]|nr:hypothetical protein GJ496_006495 [Pomphorhynchus laevis]
MRENFQNKLLQEINRRTLDGDRFTILSTTIGLGGLGVDNPLFIGRIDFECSQLLCNTYKFGLIGGELDSLQATVSQLIRKRNTIDFTDRLQSVIGQMDLTTNTAV